MKSKVILMILSFLLIPLFGLANPSNGTKEKFKIRSGIGVSLIPAEGTFYIENSRNYYQGGLKLNGIIRLHPWISGEVSVGFLAAALTNEEDLIVQRRSSAKESLKEMTYSFGIRIHLRRLPQENIRTFVLPYVALGANFALLFPETYSTGAVIQNGARAERAVYSLGSGGASLGIGTEVLLGRNVALSFELQGMLAGTIDPFSMSQQGYGGVIYSPTRAAVRAGIGFAWIF